MSSEYNRKTAVLEDRHIEFLEDENLNYSMLVRDLLDEYIEYKQQTEPFELSEDFSRR